jgi:hypothetical protein
MLLVHHRSRRPAQRPLSMQLLAERPPSDADHVLLNCFCIDLKGSGHHRDLCHALRSAGFLGPLPRHIVRTSPLLVHVSGPWYRLQRCTKIANP